MAFLSHLGLTRNQGELTVAAVLLFGRNGVLARVKPSGIVDFRQVLGPGADVSPDERWHDRVFCDGNLVEALQVLFDRLHRLSPDPFALESGGGHRRRCHLTFGRCGRPW